MRFEEIVLRPVVTEKSLSLARNGQYTFRVDHRASKLEIGKAIAKAFNVQVAKVTSSHVIGKKKAVRGQRRVVKLSDWKKVVVSLSNGKIDIFEKS